jgi:hypothetical protein
MSRVSCLSCLSLVGWVCLESAPNLVCIFVFRPADSSRDVDNPSAGHLDGLQLLPVGAGRAAGRGPRGVPGHRGRRGAGREFHGESSPRLRPACYPAYAPRTPSGGSKKPLVWWCRTTGSTSGRSPRATSFPLAL